MKKEKFIQKKLKAFTLMELVTGMILTTVTVASGFTLYLYFTKSIQKHQNEEKMVKQLYAFHFLMQKDVENCDRILHNENEIVLTNSNNEKITYKLEDTLLLREVSGGVTDTFWIHTSEIIFPEEDFDIAAMKKFSVIQKWGKQEAIWQWKKEYSPVEEINRYVLSNGH